MSDERPDNLLTAVTKLPFYSSSGGGGWEVGGGLRWEIHPRILL